MPSGAGKWTYTPYLALLLQDELAARLASLIADQECFVEVIRDNRAEAVRIGELARLRRESESDGERR